MSIKLNISYPPYGAQKRIEIDDEKKIRLFYDQTLSTEIAGDGLGDEFKGYVFKIAGGFDKQGFAMKQGVMLNHRTRLVLDGNSGHYRPRRDGCRRRKSVRGCITGPDISVLNLIITKKGPQDLAGLTDPASNRPSMRGPKRASNIRKLWGLSKDEDVRQFVSKRKIPGKEGKKDIIKSPKIQRLVTPISLQRKRRRIALKKRRFEKNKQEAEAYRQVLGHIRKEKRAAILQKKRAAKDAKEARAAAKAPADATKTDKTKTKTDKATGKTQAGAQDKGKGKQTPAQGQGKKTDQPQGAQGKGKQTPAQGQAAPKTDKPAAGAQKKQTPAQGQAAPAQGQAAPKTDKPAGGQQGGQAKAKKTPATTTTTTQTSGGQQGGQKKGQAKKQ